MTEILKTILLLSAMGCVMVVLMLGIKLFLHKYIAGRVQLILWLLVAVSFVVPMWKFMPAPVRRVIEEPVIILPQYFDNTVVTDEFATEIYVEENVVDVNTTALTQNNQTAKEKVDLKGLIFAVWVLGAAAFVIVTAVSYINFLAKKRKNSVLIEESEVFKAVKADLNIKRNVRVRKCLDDDSPFLTGVFFPIVYVPENFTDEDEEKLVYYHELTHYRNKDLIIKWCAMFVNAIHWFNPLSYVLTKNIGEACEICCDISVTKNMNQDEKKKYMNTILNLVSKKG